MVKEDSHVFCVNQVFTMLGHFRIKLDRCGEGSMLIAYITQRIQKLFASLFLFANNSPLEAQPCAYRNAGANSRVARFPE